MYEKLYDEDINVFCDNICEFWEDNGLGKLEIKLGDIIDITAFECFECSLLPKKGKPACYLDAGIFEALFTNYLKKDIEVTEVKCFTMGDELNQDFMHNLRNFLLKYFLNSIFFK